MITYLERKVTSPREHCPLRISPAYLLLHVLQVFWVSAKSNKKFITLACLCQFRRIRHAKFREPNNAITSGQNKGGVDCMWFLSSIYCGIVLSGNIQEITLDSLRSLWHWLATIRQGLAATFNAWNKYVQLFQFWEIWGHPEILMLFTANSWSWISCLRTASTNFFKCKTQALMIKWIPQ